jgi:hypothetical protein
MENGKLNFLHICDYASFSEGGKLNILGIFENINAPSIPYAHPQMFIVSNVSFKKSGNIKKVIKIVSDDNIEIAKLEFSVNVKIPADKKTANIGVAGQLNGTRFEKFGKYKIQVFINDKLIGENEISILNSSK